MKFQCDGDVWKVVQKFERCEFTLAEFDHARHLAVGVAYLSVGGLDKAIARMRFSLVRFSAHYGKQGYHETITRFWLMKLAEIEGASLWERVNSVVEALADKDLIFQYYEREVLMSAGARAEWVAPVQIVAREAKREGRIPG